jgi:exodeoxyribonuclease V beta subunit
MHWNSVVKGGGMSNRKPLELLSIPLEGVNLIEASAGTGKTHTITQLYLRLILEKELDVRRILVVTFTEAATKELIDRIRKTLQEAYRLCENEKSVQEGLLAELIGSCAGSKTIQEIRSLLNRAIIGFDEAAIHTIHGFCRRILSDYSFETSSLFDTELVSDQQKLIQQIVDDFRRRRFSEAPALFSAIVLKHGLNTAGLLELGGSVLRNPMVRIVPVVDGDASASLLDCLESIISEWKKSRDEIRNILINDGGLSRAKKKYHEDDLSTAIGNMDRIAGGQAIGVIPDTLLKFAQGTLVRSMKKNHAPPEHLFFELCEEFDGFERAYLVQLKQAFVCFLREELALRKKEQNLQSFDDLLLSVWNAILSKTHGNRFQETMREAYPAVLVDEFQDTDPVQYEIFRNLFEKSSILFYIGDPKQAIYSFRGADIYSYFKASSSIDEEKCYSLDTNWRSESGLVESVNNLFSTTANPFAAGDAISFLPSQSTPKSKGNTEPLLVENEDPSSLLTWYLQKEKESDAGKIFNQTDATQCSVNAVTTEIRRLLILAERGEARIGNRPLKPSDIAILVLKNDDAALLKDRLIQFEIPAVVTKSGNVFQSEEADEIHKILLAAAVPTRTSRLNTALSTKLLGFDGNQIQSLIEDEAEAEVYEAHIRNFIEYHELWRNRGFIRMFRRMLSDYQVRKNILALPGGDRKLTNILHLSELIHGESVRNRPGINALLSWYYQQRFSPEGSDENELRLERDDQAVQISTVFKSKGLQYPIVFCPFMWQRGVKQKPRNLSYHQNGDLFLHLDVNSIGGPELEQVRKEEMSDQLRLLYVALTRAQNRCYLVCGKIGPKAVNSLDYILNGGQDESELLIGDFLKNKSGFDDKKMLSRAQGFSGTTLPLTDHLNVSNSELLLQSEPEPDHETHLSCRNSSGKNNLIRDWGIASYSRFVSGESYRHIMAEEKLLLTDEAPDSLFAFEPSFDADSFFSFPRGRVAGTCIHGIFEDLDFTDPTLDTVIPVIRDELARFHLSESEENTGELVKQVLTMIQRVLNTPMSVNSALINLSEITNDSKLVEFEFYFPMEKVSPERLGHLFDAKGNDQLADHGELSQRIGQLSFHTIEGYMHGFIDLVFEVRGKFYIVDWKTNHLGNKYQDYAPEKLKQVMKAHYYDLQYHIYIIALHKYLENRIPDYQYEEHFGGVIYLFVRGVHPDYPGHGVYTDLPSQKLITSLCRVIKPHRGNYEE